MTLELSAQAAPEVTEGPGELQLVARARRGEIAAFEVLVARHRDRVYGLAWRVLASREEAALVTQETFSTAHRHLQRIDDDEQFASWVYRLASAAVVTRLGRRAEEDASGAMPEAPAPAGRRAFSVEASRWARRGGEDAALDAGLRLAIEGACAALGDEERVVFVLRDVEGRPYEEIAALTRASLSTVKGRLHSARLSVRAAIERFYAEREVG